MRRTTLHAAAITAALVLSAGPAIAQAAAPSAPAAPANPREWRRTLRDQINTTFGLSEASIDLRRITRAGSLLVLQKDGMATKPGIDGLSTTSSYAEGVIDQPRGLLAVLSDNNQLSSFGAGHEVYLINTGIADDRIVLQLVDKELSSITIQGNTRQVRQSGQLAILFPRGYLATAPFADVLARINEVLNTQAAVSAPKTVSLGMSREQVQAALGAPTSVVDLGTRVILVYPQMRVILQDGKVSDVQ
jgi:hypothetical protein